MSAPASAAAASDPPSSWFQRYLLPGFAFKAVVIGGGYATGRELAEFFLPSGPRGGYWAMLLAMVVWSLVCVVTFCLARLTRSWDYRAFFTELLGPFWIVFELAYLLSIIVILAVFGAAAGAIGKALLGLPQVVGTCCLIACISFVAAYGNVSVERLFKWVTFFLYGIYALFVALSFHAFGDRNPAWTRHARARHRLGAGRPDLRRLQRRRRRRHPAHAAAPARRARCGHRRRARGADGDVAGTAVLHLHDGLLPADRCAGPAVGLPAATPEPAGLPRAVPGHDLPGAARERHRERACLQRARGARLHDAHRPGAHEIGPPVDRWRRAAGLDIPGGAIRARDPDRAWLSPALVYLPGDIRGCRC